MYRRGKQGGGGAIKEEGDQNRGGSATSPSERRSKNRLIGEFGRLGSLREIRKFAFLFWKAYLLGFARRRSDGRPEFPERDDDVVTFGNLFEDG